MKSILTNVISMVMVMLISVKSMNVPTLLKMFTEINTVLNYLMLNVLVHIEISDIIININY